MTQFNANLPTLTIPSIENKCLTTPKDFLIKAQYEPTIGTLTKANKAIFPFIGAVFIKLNSLGGFKNNISDEDMTDIKNLVLMNFKGVSLMEIYKAFELERYGMYDDKTDHFQLFNASYVSDILKKYQDWKQKKKTEWNITKDSTPLLPDMSEVQKKKIHYDSLCSTYERIKENGFDDMAWLIYPYIKNKITLTPTEKKNIYKQEEVKYLNALRNSDKKSDRYEFKTFPKHEQTGRYNSAVQTQCKNRMVVEFVRPHLATLETFLKAIGYEE